MAQNRDEQEMLAALGMKSTDELFTDIPAPVRSGLQGFGNGMAEQDARRKVESILASNRSLKDVRGFLGAGAYDYYVPAAVRNIVGRSEFITSYTPYQPEISQGLLQALFEYQSMMSELTGMEVVNNSMYDYATGLGEAALMAARLSRKADTFLVPDTIPGSRFSVIKNYCWGAGLKLERYSHDPVTGQADLGDLGSRIRDGVAGALVETPNYFGVLESQMDEIRAMLDGKVLVAGVNAISLAVVRPPGDYGADIVVSDGQVLGNAVNFGGPMLGVFGCKKSHIRKMPGRIIGLTSDAEGARGFCMTLQTREQHIRREKATSNICSNEALTAVAAASYLAYMGGAGLRRMAISVMENSRELASQISSIEGCKAPKFNGHYFNEFVASFPMPARKVIDALDARNICPGVALDRPGMENDLLIAVTDKTTTDDIRGLASALKEVL